MYMYLCKCIKKLQKNTGKTNNNYLVGQEDIGRWGTQVGERLFTLHFFCFYILNFEPCEKFKNFLKMEECIDMI